MGGYAMGMLSLLSGASCGAMAGGAMTGAAVSAPNIPDDGAEGSKGWFAVKPVLDVMVGAANLPVRPRPRMVPHSAIIIAPHSKPIKSAAESAIVKR